MQVWFFRVFRFAIDRMFLNFTIIYYIIYINIISKLDILMVYIVPLFFQCTLSISTPRSAAIFVYIYFARPEGEGFSLIYIFNLYFITFQLFL